MEWWLSQHQICRSSRCVGLECQRGEGVRGRSGGIDFDSVGVEFIREEPGVGFAGGANECERWIFRRAVVDCDAPSAGGVEVNE